MMNRPTTTCPTRIPTSERSFAGGLVDIENREDVETFFRRQGYPDLDAGHQPVALGIDTNLPRLADAGCTPTGSGAIQ